MQSTITRIDELPHGKYGLHLSCRHVVVCDDTVTPRGAMGAGDAARCQACNRVSWMLMRVGGTYRFYLHPRLQPGFQVEYVVVRLLGWRINERDGDQFVARVKIDNRCQVDFCAADVLYVEWA